MKYLVTAGTALLLASGFIRPMVFLALLALLAVFLGCLFISVWAGTKAGGVYAKKAQELENLWRASLTPKERKKIDALTSEAAETAQSQPKKYFVDVGRNGKNLVEIDAEAVKDAKKKGLKVIDESGAPQ